MCRCAWPLTNGKGGGWSGFAAVAVHIGGGNLQLVRAGRQGHNLFESGDASVDGASGGEGQAEDGGCEVGGAVQQGGVPVEEGGGGRGLDALVQSSTACKSPLQRCSRRA